MSIAKLKSSFNRRADYSALRLKLLFSFAMLISNSNNDGYSLLAYMNDINLSCSSYSLASLEVSLKEWAITRDVGLMASSAIVGIAFEVNIIHC
jgi:hypothetical protein